MKNESKKATGSCPELPRTASRRSPPDGPVLQSARPRGRPRPLRSFEISEGCSLRRPRPRHQAAPRPERRATQRSEVQTARGSARGGGAVDNTLKMLTLAQGKLHVCLKKSVGGNREGEASYHFTVHTYLSRTYQEIFASNFPLFNVRMWVRQADF